MDLNQAILAHSNWKKKLKEHIDGGTQINTETLSKDDQCDLGKWILGEGKKHQSLSAFADLKAKHTKFHTVAANVARKAQSCSREEAHKMLDMTSEFGHASADVINALADLKTSLGQ